MAKPTDPTFQIEYSIKSTGNGFYKLYFNVLDKEDRKRVLNHINYDKMNKKGITTSNDSEYTFEYNKTFTLDYLRKYELLSKHLLDDLESGLDSIGSRQTNVLYLILEGRFFDFAQSNKNEMFPTPLLYKAKSGLMTRGVKDNTARRYSSKQRQKRKAAKHKSMYEANETTLSDINLANITPKIIDLKSDKFEFIAEILKLNNSKYSLDINVASLNGLITVTI